MTRVPSSFVAMRWAMGEWRWVMDPALSTRRVRTGFMVDRLWVVVGPVRGELLGVGRVVFGRGQRPQVVGKCWMWRLQMLYVLGGLGVCLGVVWVGRWGLVVGGSGAPGRR